MASVIGKWKIESSENFEEYMKAIGEYKYFFVMKNYDLHVITMQY